jgi:hypothetical protein
MTDMNASNIKVFGPRFMLAMLLATFATFALAQEGTDYDLEPGVQTSTVGETSRATDTSAEFEPAVDTSSARDESPEDIEPAVSSAVLAADVTRDETGSQVMDRLELGRTEITGNQELPKVLYIVPWQKSDPGNLMGKPVNSLMDEVLAPLDREEFIRQVDYYGDLYGED